MEERKLRLVYNLLITIMKLSPHGFQAFCFFSKCHKTRACPCVAEAYDPTVANVDAAGIDWSTLNPDDGVSAEHVQWT